MSAFDNCCRVEQESLPRLLDWLESQADSGRVVLTSKGPLSKFLQETVGDALMQKNGAAYGAEFKIEQRWTGNLFLETWSNLERFNPGWLVKLDADVLLYYFADKKMLITVPFKKLKRWAFGGKDTGSAHVYRYPEKQQRKYTQLNDTWGRIVPVDVLVDEAGARTYTLEAEDAPAVNLFAVQGA
jgi:hypothetical protein